MSIANRVKELRMIRAGDLVRNPKNWRKHPDRQRRAVQTMLELVGYADALISRETPEGLELIDGHLRASLDDDQLVPVLVTDITDEEADQVLASLDPLAAMAEPDHNKLDRLLQDIARQGNEAIDALMKKTHQIPAPEDFTPVDMPETRLDRRAPVTCPKCRHEFLP